jgi:four helix bundle protein
MKNFRDLSAWQKSYRLTLAVYRETKSFPKEEQFGLTSQIRRAASSMPANIAEGCCRDGDAEFKRFLFIAMGSASELECHLLIARDLGFLAATTAASLEADTQEVKRMLAALIAKLNADC